MLKPETARAEVVEALYVGIIDALLELTVEHEATSGEVLSAALTVTKGLALSMLDNSPREAVEKNRESVVAALERIMLALYEQKRVM